MEKDLLESRVEAINSYIRNTLDGVRVNTLDFHSELVEASASFVSSTDIKPLTISLLDRSDTLQTVTLS